MQPLIASVISRGLVLYFLTITLCHLKNLLVELVLGSCLNFYRSNYKKSSFIIFEAITREIFKVSFKSQT